MHPSEQHHACTAMSVRVTNEYLRGLRQCGVFSNCDFARVFQILLTPNRIRLLY
jgi:hypothetical protein